MEAPAPTAMSEEAAGAQSAREAGRGSAIGVFLIRASGLTATAAAIAE